jgi:hypothetical protein
MTFDPAADPQQRRCVCGMPRVLGMCLGAVLAVLLVIACLACGAVEYLR